MYVIENPNGPRHEPPRGLCWGATEPVFRRHLDEGRVYFPRNGAGRPRIKQYMGEETGLVPMSLWLADDRSEEHTSELQSLMRISYAVSCLKKKTALKSTNYQTRHK